jgi:proton-coupled amino acid transporter
MRKPESFSMLFGVLNMGMILVTCIYITLGTIGYWKFGEEAQGTLTLNLPREHM